MNPKKENSPLETSKNLQSPPSDPKELALAREKLREKLKTLPNVPGVYLHKNLSGEVIYVGKAAVLKNRVRQYFQKSQKDPKTTALVAEIANTDWLIVETEMDALFLESELIKRYMPKWNILLRDDKTVSYVRIDLKSEVPHVEMTRTPLDDGARYVGPFYGKTTVERALRILRRIFPYFDRPFSGKKTLNTDLGLEPNIIASSSKDPKKPDLDPLALAQYKKDLKKLILYLQGGRKKLLNELEKQMRSAAKSGNFEEAAHLRNQLFSLKELRKKIVFSDKEFLDISSDQALTDFQTILKLPNPPRRIEGYDISHQSGTNVVGSMVVFVNGVSDRAEYRKFKLKTERNNDFANMREVLERRLKHHEWDFPDVVLIDGGEPQLEAVHDLLDSAKIPYFGLAKGEEIIVLPVYAEDGSVASYRHINIANNTHIIKLLQRIRNEAHRFAITYHTLLKRKNLLK